MIYIFYGIYVLACLFLILVILLQSGKGGDVASAFGGAGSQTAFGPRGAQKPLEKATITAAVIFMLFAMIFSLPGITGGRSVVTAPVETATPTPSPSASAAAATSASPATSVSPAASASPSAAASAKAGATSASPAASASASPAKK